jgi:hypothetical protein
MALPALTKIISAVGPTVASAATAISGATPYLLAGGSALGALGQYRAGQAQEEVLKAQAERTKLAATDERIARNERLLRSMASRTAGAGARGVTLSTIAPSQAEDIRQTAMGQQAADATMAGNVATMRARGRNARQAGAIAGGASLARTLLTLRQTG